MTLPQQENFGCNFQLPTIIFLYIFLGGYNQCGHPSSVFFWGSLPTLGGLSVVGSTPGPRSLVAFADEWCAGIFFSRRVGRQKGGGHRHRLGSMSVYPTGICPAGT